MVVIFQQLNYGRIRLIRRLYEKISVSSVCWLSGIEEESANGNSKISIPEAPTNCCMSGCANCVWILYAEELSKLFKDGGEKSREIIMSKITDPNMKAFLSLELKSFK